MLGCSRHASILPCAHYSKRSKKCCTLLLFRVQRRTVVGQTYKNYVVGNVVSDKLRLACALLHLPSISVLPFSQAQAVGAFLLLSPGRCPSQCCQHNTKRHSTKAPEDIREDKKGQASGTLLRRDDRNTSTRRHCCVASSFQRPLQRLLLPIDSYLVYSFKNTKDE